MEIKFLKNIASHKKVAYCKDPKSGLKALIAVHDTTLGPALGGTRMWNYKNFDDALNDVLKLSRGMTYKAALANLNLGGGKAVIIGDSKNNKSEALMRSFGRFVESFEGEYITAEDVGMNTNDIDIISKETKYVTGTSTCVGGSGDPSIFTALGVYYGIKASAKLKWGNESLNGKSILVQGIGNVGLNLIENLSKEDAVIFFNDIDKEKIKFVLDNYKNAKFIKTDKIFETDIDIFSPCALGGVVNSFSIPKFKFKIIAGAANNQLLDEKNDSELLHQKNIFYVPDFLINAGGLINVYSEIADYSKSISIEKTKKIYQTTIKVFEKSQKELITTHQAALSIAKDILRSS